VRFAHKDSHQLFIEPEGRATDEMYVQGLNTSLPEDVQLAVLRSIPGMENVRILRTGYAIEYDYVIPSQLKLSLESKVVEALFTAGQINGTSGYEEAAAQGLIAGINAACKVQNKQPFILKRSEAYIGVLIDDLVTKEADEPYRLLTSRAEYRLLLRQDNADLRLTEKGREIGLVSDQRWAKFMDKKTQLEEMRSLLEKTTFTPADRSITAYLEEIGSAMLRDRVSLWELLRRPEVTIDDLLARGLVLEMKKEIREQLEIQSKYEGYIQKQQEQVKRFEKLESKAIPTDMVYREIKTLSSEAMQKLEQFKPETIGQASRISGVTPADVNILLIFLKKREGIK